MTIQTRTTTFVQFLVRLCGILGGVYICAGYSYRAINKTIGVIGKMRGEQEKSYEQYAQSYSSSLRTSGGMGSVATSRTGSAGRWMDGSGLGKALGGGLGHRPTNSVMEKIYSGEQRKEERRNNLPRQGMRGYWPSTSFLIRGGQGAVVNSKYNVRYAFNSLYDSKNLQIRQRMQMVVIELQGKQKLPE
jgi:hypothetical protein